ncbi:MAG: type II toxin-antitoxin system VapC family toxin [bacterium]|nr:type II toxin-antitoxin system VapC family toxin [bacterium]
MKVLIDTHIALWALIDDPKMPTQAGKILMDENNEIYYSTASVWEVAIKHCIRPDDAPKHNDPFDRLLICQSKTEGMKFLTHDLLLSDYNEDCIIYV